MLSTNLAGLFVILLTRRNWCEQVFYKKEELVLVLYGVSDAFSADYSLPRLVRVF